MVSDNNIFHPFPGSKESGKFLDFNFTIEREADLYKKLVDKPLPYMYNCLRMNGSLLCF